ncbi:MAG: TIGR03621 family F420-dependent LLM class oxidoreductase [Nocardiopsaceae bacterium]|jgi:probable F420-dependent oxidoreductase|nr:TIGR03621 family F420-dependent LLM class oxidoreductase [Nocardiopsaceae bacterium]
MSDIRFGVNFHAASDAAAFEQTVRQADELGFDVLAAPDHLGAMSPFTLLAAAALITRRLRLRTYVLNVGFWNPALLAREVATLDLISGGRAELGLGAGHMKSEHDDAGLPWLPFRQRIDLLEATVTEVRRRLFDPGHEPAPVQQPVPLMVAAMSGAGLGIAARHAEIIGFAGLRQVRGESLGTFTLVSAEETAERVAAVREQAGGRAYRSDVLLQQVAIGPSPDESAAKMAAAVPWMSAEQVKASPFVLYAESADQAAAELGRRHEVYGFDSVTTHQPSMEELGQVIAAYRS